jgi:signal peptidase II
VSAPPSIRTLVAVPLAVVAVDQATKLWVAGRMELFESLPVVPGFFHITYIRNPGAAFGLFSEAHGVFRMSLLIGVSLLAVGLLTTFFLRSPHADRLSRMAAVLVMGGALGNLIDRLRFGEVIDFLDVFVGGHHWPAFNLADSAISIGIGLFVLCAWRDRGRAREEVREGAPVTPAGTAAGTVSGPSHKPGDRP